MPKVRDTKHKSQPAPITSAGCPRLGRAQRKPRALQQAPDALRPLRKVVKRFAIREDPWCGQGNQAVGREAYELSYRAELERYGIALRLAVTAVSR